MQKPLFGRVMPRTHVPARAALDAQSRVLTCAIGVALASTPRLLAQEPQSPKKLYETMVKPDKVLSLERCKGIREQLDELLASPKHSAEIDRPQRIWIEVYLALSLGDAAGARKWFDQATPGDGVLYPQSGYLVGAASGDAELADRMLAAWADADPSRRDFLRPRSQWLDKVGQRAPDLSLHASNSTEAALSQPGKVIVLDFWNPEDVSPRSATALARAFQDYQKDEHVAFIGVCSATADAAKAALEKAQRRWPQVFADADPSPGTIREAFGEPAAPLLVIDPAGRVRAAASADDPAFHYALRAAAREAAGDFANMRLRTRTGVEAGAGAEANPKADTGKVSAAPKPLRSDPEAARMLDEARLFIRTGRKNDARSKLQEIISRFPDTREAEDAKERLRML